MINKLRNIITTKRHKRQQEREHGNLPMILAATILLGGTALLIAGLSISQNRNAELSISETQMSAAIVGCESHIKSELGRLGTNTIPMEFQTGLPKTLEGCTFSDMNTEVQLVSATLYPNSTAPTSIKVELSAQYEGFTNNNTVTTRYVTFPEKISATHPASDSDFIIGFEDNGTAIWSHIPRLKNIAPPVPNITWNTTGWNNWSASEIVCPQSNIEARVQYSYRHALSSLNPTGEYTEWSFTNPTSIATGTWNQGNVHSVQIKTRCISEAGNLSAETVSPVVTQVRPITAPTAPTYASTNAGTTHVVNFNAATCPAGTTAQYRLSSSVNGGAWTAWTPAGWGTNRSLSIVTPEGQYSYGKIQARCVSTYAQSNASGEGLTPQLLRPLPAPPAPSSVVFSGVRNYGADWTAVSCPAGSSSQYTVELRKKTGTTWGAWGAPVTFTTNFSNTSYLTAGQTGELRVKVRCWTGSEGTSSNWSPTRSSGEYTRIPEPPAAPSSLTFTAPSTASWTAVSCPANTHPEYRLRTNLNGSGWRAWSSYTTARTLAVTSNPGDKMVGEVQARCVVTANAALVSTASPSRASATYTRANTAPTGSLSVTWATNGTFSFNQLSCAAGSTVRYGTSYKTLTSGNYKTNPALGTYNTMTWGTSTSSVTIMNPGYPARALVSAKCVNTASGVESPTLTNTETDWYMRPHNFSSQSISLNHGCSNGQTSGCYNLGKHASSTVSCPAGSAAYTMSLAATATNTSFGGGYVHQIQNHIGTWNGGSITARTFTSGTSGAIGTRTLINRGGSPAARGWGTNWVAQGRVDCQTPYAQTIRWATHRGGNFQGGLSILNSTTTRYNDNGTNTTGSFPG